jgi:GT2 family glycosyltransferase
MHKAKVVILNWNGRDHLLRFLPSVVATTPGWAGVVVADNGSKDDSLEILAKEFPTVEVIEMELNHGFAGGYNIALSRLDAEYFVLLNSDVKTTSQWLEPLIEALEADPMLYAVAPKVRSCADPGKFEYAGASGGFIDIFGYPFCRGRILSTVERDSGQYDDARYTFWATGACLAARRELFTEVGGFDADFFAHMEEIDLCWRAQLFGYKVGVAPRSVVYHLGGGTLPNDSPRKAYLNYRNSLAMLYKNLRRGNFLIILPLRVLLDVASSLIFLLRGKSLFFKSIYRAHFDFYRWRGRGLRTRRSEIHSRAIARPEGVYFGSIVLRYFLGFKKFGHIIR